MSGEIRHYQPAGLTSFLLLSQERTANLGSSIFSGTSSVGTYACAIGDGSLDVASPCKYVLSCVFTYPRSLRD